MRKDFFVFIILLFPLQILSAQNEYIISRASFSSPRYDEFSPVFYNGGVVFCSNRDHGLFSDYSTIDNKSFFKLFFADTARGTTWQNSRLLAGSVNSNLNNGPAAFNRSGDTIYFSRNLVVDGSFKDITGKGNKLGLFFAVMKNGEWTEVQEMRFNDNGWNVTTPFITPDGKKLYFASDKPEGYGGSDLYYSEWKNGYWNNPVNLGSIVNTGGNEAYPFVNDSGELFYSSDSLPGKGGKDIFYTRYADTSWIKPVNLNAPLNSSDNDFGFIADGMVSHGYFSSDRAGMLDIYSFRTVVPQFLYCEPEPENNLCFSFTDDASIDIDPISLQFSWDFGDGNKSSGYVVQHCFKQAGKYTIRQTITEKKSGIVVFEKAVADLNIEKQQLPQIIFNEQAIPGKEITLSAGIALPGYEPVSYFWNFGDNKSVHRGESVKYVFGEGETRVRLLAYLKESSGNGSRQVCVEKLVRPTSDKSKVAKKNNFSIPLSLTSGVSPAGVLVEKIYPAADEITSKAVFAVRISESSSPVSINNASFNSISSRYVVKRIKSGKNYSYIIDEQTSFMSAYPSFRDAVTEGFRDARIITYVPVDTGEIELWNFKRTYGTASDVYFLNNGTTISKKAMPVLDRLILLLKRNPDMKLLVAAHTDRNTTANSAMQLTMQQAQSIVDYLVMNGINRARLKSAGYGSIRPVTPDYPESERLKNRRVDFIKLD